MAAVKELLKAEADGTLSFGDYTLGSKTKLDGFEFQGDLYKVKTFAEITKLEKNGMYTNLYREHLLRTLRQVKILCRLKCQEPKMHSLLWN